MDVCVAVNDGLPVKVARSDGDCVREEVIDNDGDLDCVPLALRVVV